MIEGRIKFAFEWCLSFHQQSLSSVWNCVCNSSSRRNEVEKNCCF